MIQQFHSGCTSRKNKNHYIKQIHAPLCSQQHYLHEHNSIYIYTHTHTHTHIHTYKHTHRHVMIKLKLGLYHPGSHPESFCYDLEMLIKATNMQLTCNVKGLLFTFLKEIESFFQSFLHLYQFLRIYSHLLFLIEMENI